MLYSFLTALLRDELRHYEMKNPRNGVDFIGFTAVMRFSETS